MVLQDTILKINEKYIRQLSTIIINNQNYNFILPLLYFLKTCATCFCKIKASKAHIFDYGYAYRIINAIVNNQERKIRITVQARMLNRPSIINSTVKAVLFRLWICVLLKI